MYLQDPKLRTCDAPGCTWLASYGKENALLQQWALDGIEYVIYLELNVAVVY